jgi:non-homologous end joining protein Ku
MDAKDFVLQAERDAILIAAMRHALCAMELTNGSIVRMEGVRGVLHYEPQMEKLKMALHLLGMNATDYSRSLIRG